MGHPDGIGGSLVGVVEAEAQGDAVAPEVTQTRPTPGLEPESGSFL